MEEKDLKDTLSMPNTEFPMRAGLKDKEPLYIKNWQDGKLYEKMLENRVNAPIFMIHDGPPYANGDIHCGHAVNRCLKDFVLRYKALAGFKTPFTFGWDTHGLPIEVKVTKSGVDRKKTPVADFREKCKEYALTQVERQKEEIIRLGCLGDIDHPYLTLNKEFEARQIDVFADMALKGLIFKGVKPVYWSPSSESALAEAEIEYHDVTAKTMYVSFDVTDGKGKLDNTDKVLIWTTTPWTIPADLAITLNPKFEYGLFDTDKGRLVFLVSLKEKLVTEIGFTRCKLIKTFKGQELEYIKVRHPLYEKRESTLILASFVTEDSGTGCVHTAPDHGLDDFNACLKYNIKPFCPVDEKGYMHLEESDPCNGLFYEVANDKVIELLEANGHLLKEIDIVHSYPHDWRTKKPVIFRATPQWFCSIEPIRQKLLDAIKEIEWIPSWGEGKMTNMIKDRADWCISRQRAWGVPLPIIYNEDGSPILEKEVFKHIRDLFAEHGSNIWFRLEAKDLLPEGYKNAASPKGNFTKETDIMDVWFDSGSSWNGVLNERGQKYPCDLYLEGNDQYRGWFNSSMILSMAVNGVAPFKTCLTHGWIMDENWQKMSKSAGNGVDPNKIANMFGADILRLWAASVDYRADARIGEGIISTVADNYRKIRNTFKFMLGNISSFDGTIPTKLNFLDRSILGELNELIVKTKKAYDRYEFSSVLNLVMSFLTGDLSSFYLDVNKGPLYCDSLSSSRRQAIVYVIYRCCVDLCLILLPILPFTMEEVYSYLPNKKKEFAQLDDYPLPTEEKIEKDFPSFLSLRDLALKELEELRVKGDIGASNEARLIVTTKDESLFATLSNEADLALFFNVAEVILNKGNEDKVIADKSTFPVCPRCREHVKELNEEGLCQRCEEALKGR